MALAKDFDLLAAVRTAQIAVILHDTKYGNPHHVSHFHSLAHNHGNQVLGGGDNDNAIHRNALEHGQGDITGSGRHIHKQIIHILPDDLGPELLHSTGNNGTAPHNGVSRIIQQQIDGHDLNASAAQTGIQAVFISTLHLGHAKGSGHGGAGDIGIQNANPLALPGHGHGQQGGDGGLTNTALAGYNGDDLLHRCIGIQLFQQALFFSLAAVGRAAGTIAIARTHFTFAPFSFFSPIIGWSTFSVNLQIPSWEQSQFFAPG